MIEEEVVNNIVSDIQIEYPQDNQNLSLPNTPSKILKETEGNDRIDNETFEAFNTQDEKISQELIMTARNELIKSVTGEGSKVLT